MGAMKIPNSEFRIRRSRIANGASVGYARSMGEWVAIVEDEENIRENVSFALEREGYRVDGYGDGIAAWEAFQQELPQLVILDIIMPRMDGLELCRKIRSLSENVPIIFLTSRDEEFDRVLGLELGADDYLCKPFSMRELLARVKVLFRRVALGTRARGCRGRTAAYRKPRARPASLHGAVGQRYRPPDRDRVHDPPRTGPSPRSRQDPRTTHERRLPPRHLRLGSNHRLPHQEDPKKIPGDRCCVSTGSKPCTASVTAIPRNRPDLDAMSFRYPSRISLRLLAFNVLLVFLPVGGVLFLDTYERHLLDAQERTMAQEGRLLAASLEARDRLDGEDAQRILIQLDQRQLARLRVVNELGEVVADSALLGPRLETESEIIGTETDSRARRAFSTASVRCRSDWSAVQPTTRPPRTTPTSVTTCSPVQKSAAPSRGDTAPLPASAPDHGGRSLFTSRFRFASRALSKAPCSSRNPPAGS